MATVTVDSNTSYQTFLGWQASGDTGVLDYPVRHVNWTDAVLDACVDLGINQVRVGLHSGIAENSTDYFGTYLATNADGDDNGPGEAAWDAVKANWRIPVNDNADPNSMNASGFKWAMLDQQIDEVIVPLKAKLEARGETLRWGVSYIHFATTNQLHIDDPDEYGELILATWQHIEATYGYLPDFLEPFLEPDGTAQVTASELAAMIAAARNRLVAAGFAKPYIVAPSTVSGPNASTFYSNLKTANVTAAGYIDELGYHRYQDIDNIALASLRSLAEIDLKNTGMTEFGGADISHLHNDLKVGRVSSWEEYALGFPGVPDNGYQHFIVGAGPTYALTEAVRTKYLRHYTYAVRRGAVMKGVSVAGTGAANVDALPFRNANGTYVVVAKCSAAVDFDISGLPNGTYEVRYTTGNGTTAPSAYWQSLSDQVVTTGSTGTISMPAAGVVTIYEQNFLANTGYQLYVSKNAGPYQFIGGAVKPYNSTNLTDGAVTTSRLTGGTGAFIAGEVSEDGTVDDYTITTNDYSEVLYSIELESSLLANADTLDFRVYYNGQLLGAYDHTPRLTITQLVNYTLTAEPGMFTYSGGAANLLRGLRLGADVGSFSYTGADAGLQTNTTLTAENGDFTYTGGDANLLKGWRLAAETGTFVYSGADATLIYTPVGGYSLTADAGVFSYTGQNANLLRGLRLLAETGTFSYTGNDATLIYSPVGSYNLLANTGVFTYTGHPANLLRALRIIAETGVFSYTGQNANLVKGYRLLAETGTFNYAGVDAALLLVRRLIAQGATFSYSGGQVVLTHAGFVIPLPAPLTMILDLHERSMMLDSDERSMILED